MINESGLWLSSVEALSQTVRWAFCVGSRPQDTEKIGMDRNGKEGQGESAKVVCTDFHPGCAAADGALASTCALVHHHFALSGGHQPGSGWGPRPVWRNSAPIPPAQAESTPDIADFYILPASLAIERVPGRGWLARLCTGKVSKEMGAFGRHAHPGGIFRRVAAARVSTA